MVLTHANPCPSAVDQTSLWVPSYATAKHGGGTTLLDLSLASWVKTGRGDTLATIPEVKLSFRYFN